MEAEGTVEAARAHPVEVVAASTLKPHPKNYRRHGPEQLAHIAASLRANGFYRNVVVARDGTILAGHGVVEACLGMEVESIPVIRLDLDPDDPRALKVLAGDNEIGRLAEVDDRMLTEILKGISGAGADALLGTGFDPMQLAALALVTRSSAEIPDANAAQEWVGMPAYADEDPSRRQELLLAITFQTEEDREKFVAGIGLRIRDKRGGRKWSTNWPYREKDDVASVEFQGGATA